MSDGSIEVPWQWSFVGGTPQWQAATAALFDEWLGITSAAGATLAGQLAERAASLPAGSRLVWGAGFDATGPRWWPVQVVVQRVGHADGDPDYLLDLVGARVVVDGVAPDVVYSSTSFGDSVRTTVRERGPHGLVNALVRAATRIEWPGSERADLLLTTRVWDMSLLAVIGPGLDGLMRQLAAAIAPDTLESAR